MTYQPSYQLFKQAFHDIRKSLLEIALTRKYEDAVLVPAMLAVTADLSTLSSSTDSEIIAEFQKCLFDARTRNTERNPQ